MAANEAKNTTQSNVAVTAASQTSLSNSENDKPRPTANAVSETNLERAAEKDGYLLDEAQIREKYKLGPDAQLKKAADGKVLIPQPSDSSEDPLNWSKMQKLAVLVVLVANSFTADYSAATGASALLPQAEEWHISPNVVNHATAG